MSAFLSPKQTPARRWLVVAIIGVHWLLYWLLFQLPPHWRVPAGTAHPDPALVVWQLPASPPPAMTPLPPPAQPAPSAPAAAPPRQVARAARAIANTLPAAISPAPAIPAPTPLPAITLPAAVVAAPSPPAVSPLPITVPGRLPDSLTGALSPATRRELARIAGDLRKESRFPADFNVHPKQDKLAAGIADAYRGDGPVTITDIRQADGSVMTKVTGPLGSMCIYKDSVGHTGGRDQMQSGVPTKVTTCPQ